MEITLIDSIDKLLEFEKEWKRLSDEAHISFFSTFDYIRLAWNYFSIPSDKLMIMVMRQNSKTVGIVPFRLSMQKVHKLPISLKTVKFISEWEGDKPGIITNIDKKQIWHHIYNYLNNNFVSWDKVVFSEQDKDSQEIITRLFSDFKKHMQLREEFFSYFISLDGAWDNYLMILKSKVRNSYKSRLKKLNKLNGGFAIESFKGKKSLKRGLDRFVAIENRGWKKSARIGVGRNLCHKKFYNELLALDIQNYQACIYIMESGGVDLAGIILLKFKKTIYESQIVYNPDYSKYSPAIILRAQVLKSLFDTFYENYDMMGMYQQKPKHKTQWATSSKGLISIEIYNKKKIHLLPLIWAKHFKETISGLGKLNQIYKKVFSVLY
ncbi:MAG: GNAT family N-acetyltransferase [Desulfobacteraceae bacterium]|nr:GNAT family N-acetyltransferase [Desulfobacteraceae bacterium]